MFIEIIDDYGSTYVETSLLMNSKFLVLERVTNKDDEEAWMVRFENDDMRFMYDTKDRAKGCYEYLKAFVRDKDGTRV